MFQGFKEILFGKPRPPKVKEFTHPELGKLILNDEVDCWEVKVQKDGDTFEFGIEGEQTPDPALIQHAMDILNDYPRFKDMVNEFLQSETRNLKHFEQEIKQLTIDQVFLCRPDRPNDGMIYFKGPDEFRLWRCDYVSRKPKDLGFDD